MKHEQATYSDPALNYEIVTTGDAPSSIEVTINAKGEAQINVKLYFADVDDLAREGPERIAAIVVSTEMRLRDEGYLLAGSAARREGK